MLQAILNMSWRKHPSKQQLYGHQLPITKTIKIRRARHAGHCWRSWDELIGDVLLWTPSHGRAKAGRPAQTYIYLCADTVCSLEEQPEVIDNKEVWWESQKYPCYYREMMMTESIESTFIWKSNHCEDSKNFIDNQRVKLQ